MLISANAQAAMIDSIVTMIDYRANQYDSLTKHFRDVSSFKTEGNTIKVPSMTIGSAQVVTDGGAFTSVDPSLTSVNLVIDKKVGNMIQISDTTVEDSALDILGESFNAIVDNMILKVNESLISTAVANLQAGSTVTGATIFDRVKAAALILDTRKAPKTGRKLFMKKSSILTLLNTTDTLNRVTGLTYDGFKVDGNYLGFEIVEVDSASLPENNDLALHLSAVVFYMGDVEMKSQTDIATSSTFYRLSSRYGVASGNKDLVVVLDETP